MLTTNKKHIALLADYCAQHGPRKIVISPGSRNAPLITAFESHPQIETFLIHDERVAAFVALGMAEELGEPVGVTCTSGSALLNYSPAIVEAYYRQIPLMIFSADRPLELIDQGDGQTIRQENVYRNFIKGSFQLPNHDAQDQFKKVNELLFQSFALANQSPKGPVHFNIPLAEPLYELDNWSISQPEIKESSTNDNFELSSGLAEIWKSTEKKLILIGQGPLKPGLAKQIELLAEDPSVAILVENTSNIQHFSKIVHCIDRTLETIGSNEVENFVPELLVTFGGAIISKRIKSFFRNNKPKHNWRVGVYTIQEDTFQSLTEVISVSPVSFLVGINKLEVSAISNFGAKWKQKDFLAQDVHEQFVETADFSDLKAFDLILDALPESANLHMGNSSVVRYCQLFNPIKSIQYYANRGVSGIDGSSSTAIGVSMVSPSKLNLIISGDISFFYDSNAFWNDYLNPNLRIIVIKNGGGGIFQIIDGPLNSPYSETFFAPFDAKIKGICDAYGLEFLEVNSAEDLFNSFKSFYTISSTNRPKLMVVNTSNQNNAPILRSYFDSLKSLKN
ncbi:MAG: 2-succinyl-5-enolpyruvyl-6-hydroxy-3-cyclohexene-1-carboxylic-acid synthase [Crocinitomicaceae bacterium]